MIPCVRHQKNGAVIARCSQPEISWWGWRNTDDEYLVTSIAKACQMGTKGAWRQRGEAPDSCDSDFGKKETKKSFVKSVGVIYKLQSEFQALLMLLKQCFGLVNNEAPMSKCNI